MDAIEMLDACIDATREFVTRCGYREVVVGLSGGIDSALVAAIAVEALGAENVHAVLMPGPFSSGHSVTDATAEAEALGIDAQTISIAEACDAFDSMLEIPCGGVEGEGLTGVTCQNVQARCRMIVLMALSNARDWLVLNTGNKSEVYTGYSTLYGDMVGAFAPIGGLYKTDVYRVARALNERVVAAGRPQAIPDSVLEKAPSAELAPGQTDEASLGISYRALDEILHAHLEGGMDEEALVEAGFDADEVALVLRKMRSSAFKRPLEPPAPDVEFYD